MSNLFTFCGLYCGDCPELAKGCPGCQQGAPEYPCAVRPCAIENPLRIAANALLFPVTNSMPWLTMKNWAPMANCWTP